MARCSVCGGYYDPRRCPGESFHDKGYHEDGFEYVQGGKLLEAFELCPRLFDHTSWASPRIYDLIMEHETPALKEIPFKEYLKTILREHG